jgi:hypothetical protein
MSKLNQDQIRNLALKIIGEDVGGIRYSELVKKIAELNPETPINTIHGSVWDLPTRYPDQVVKPSRGLYKSTSAEDRSERIPRERLKYKEEDFYKPFAEYLKNDLDEVTASESLGGCGMKSKWGTPDVIGVYKSLASHLVKFPIEIVSAEIKIDTQNPIVAFGQAISYRLFSSKCYVVMPKSISDEDSSRLEALCMLFGVGLVLYNTSIPKTPEFEIRVRAQRFSPDMFYVNEFARRLHQHKPALFEQLFS